MSKRELKKYLKSLEKNALEDQIEDLYNRFKEVKVFYDFVFNPNESKLLEDAKIKISREFFPVNGRKPKMRRSVAQKNIRHFITLGVDTSIIGDLMLYSIEIAQAYTSQYNVNQDAFYKSMHNLYAQTAQYLKQQGYVTLFIARLEKIKNEAKHQKWNNFNAFDITFESIHNTK